MSDVYHKPKHLGSYVSLSRTTIYQVTFTSWVLFQTIKLLIVFSEIIYGKLNSPTLQNVRQLLQLCIIYYDDGRPEKDPNGPILLKSKSSLQYQLNDLD